MIEVKVKVADLYDLRAQIVGWKTSNLVKKADGIEEVVEKVWYLGFVNEKGITEGTKRIANKIDKKILAELITIDEQRKAIADDKYEGSELTKEQIEADKNKRNQVLMDDEVTISLEELIDFNKVADLTLSNNYVMLYEKIFKNY